MGAETHSAPLFRVAHLTTVDLSLRFLVFPQLKAVVDSGGEAVGISSPGPWVSELEAADVHHLPLRSSTRGVSLMADIRSAFELWRILRSVDLTVLHTHNPKPGLYGRILGRIAGVPLVVNTVHGLYATEDDPFLKRVLVYLLEAIAARFSHVELFQNIEDLELCRKLRILPSGKGELLGNGVDLNRFDPSNVDLNARRKVREELGVAEDQVLVGMVGRLVVEKGYLEFFSAVADLDDRFATVVVGPADPDKPDAVPQEAIAEAKANGTAFLGMRTDMEEIYSALDVFVLPSHREGFPRAAMEAAAMGLPLVATDIRGCRQVVDNGVNGILVPVGDATELRQAVLTVTEKRDEMSAASRAIARQRFDEDEVVRIVMESYRAGLRSGGMAHLLPPSMSAEPADAPRRAGVEDVAALANLHYDYIGGGFLRRLGRPFMRVLYKALVTWDGSDVFLVEDGEGPVAYVAGVRNVGDFYRYFLRHHSPAAVLAAAPRMVRPSNLRRAWETLSYGGEESDVEAEILAVAVAPRARGQGLASTLLDEVLGELTHRGTEAVRVVVGSDNLAALGAYEKAGFERWRQVEVHPGESSEMLVWRQ